MSSTDATFVKEQLRRTFKNALRYPSDYTPRDGLLLKRRTLLPVPASVLATTLSPSSVSQPGPEVGETTTLTVKTLAGQAYKLPWSLGTGTGAQLHAATRQLCGVAEGSTIRLLRQGRVIPDSEADLAGIIVDPSVPLNLIEQPSKKEPGVVGGGAGAPSEGFWRELDALLCRHVNGAQARDRVRRGVRDNWDQWMSS